MTHSTSDAPPTPNTPRRHLILLIDGTGVTASRTDDGENFSNIYRLNLAMGNFAKKESEAQITFYISGIGSSTARPRYRSQALGLGLLRDVEQAYMNICANYKHHDEGGRRDAIYIFGFSRGAVVARLVADLIARNGLLHERDAGSFNKVWQAYLLEAINEDREGWTSWQKFQNGVIEGARNLFWKMFISRTEPVENIRTRLTVHHGVHIEFLGLFDTVLGLYRGDYDVGIAAALKRSQYLARNIKYAVQLLAIDEARKRFWPVLWKSIHASRKLEDQDAVARQIWMPGVHSDIGGGYPETHCADVALLTMLNEILGRKQLKLHGRFYDELKARVDEYYNKNSNPICIHNEKTLLWRLIPFHNRGVRGISNANGVVQRLHDFAQALGERTTVNYKGVMKAYKHTATDLLPYEGRVIPVHGLSSASPADDD